MKRRLGGPTLAFHVLILSDCILTDLIAGGCKRSGWVEVQERGHAKEKTLLHFNLKKVSCSSRSNWKIIFKGSVALGSKIESLSVGRLAHSTENEFGPRIQRTRCDKHHCFHIYYESISYHGDWGWREAFKPSKRDYVNVTDKRMQTCTPTRQVTHLKRLRRRSKPTICQNVRLTTSLVERSMLAFIPPKGQVTITTKVTIINKSMFVLPIVPMACFGQKSSYGKHTTYPQ